MFWDGYRWVPGDGQPAQPQPHAPRRARDWLSTGVLIATLAVLVVPFSGAFAAAPSAKTLLAEWRSALHGLSRDAWNRYAASGA